MTLEQLKSELQEKEKELKGHLERGLKEGNECCMFLKIKISALKKGISVCEEALSQRNQEILEIIDNLPCKGETHGFRPKWIDAKELKQQIKGESK